MSVCLNFPSGKQVWVVSKQDKIRHREDGPAVIYPDGTEEWYLNGKRHRRNGPAIIRPPRSERINDKYAPNKEWYVHGKRHCEYGPAVIDRGYDRSIFREYKYWYLDDKKYSFEEWAERVKNLISKKWVEHCEGPRTSI